VLTDAGPSGGWRLRCFTPSFSGISPDEQPAAASRAAAAYRPSIPNLTPPEIEVLDQAASRYGQYLWLKARLTLP
jgi:hypothetical protein